MVAATQLLRVIFYGGSRQYIIVVLILTLMWTVDTKNLPETIDVEAPLLLNLGSVSIPWRC